MITTQRLVLRHWRPEDREAYAAMMTDPQVSFWLGTESGREGVLASIDRLEAYLETNGDGVFVMERRTDNVFVGSAELMAINSALPVAPGHEIGWRLARWAWGNGYASEAARALLAFGFDQLSLAEIIAFTAETNTHSRAVMERVGMRRDSARDFDHPTFAAGHPLHRHIVYSARP